MFLTPLAPNGAAAAPADPWLEPMLEYPVEVASAQVDEPPPPLPPTIEELVCSKPWPCSQALKVMRCESHGNPLARNGQYLGLFQIGSLHYWQVASPSDLYDPETNIDVAFRLYTARRWGPWSCKP